MPYNDWLAHPWEGPTTYVRQRAVRGSAAGAHVEREICVMAGYDRHGRARSQCGATYDAPVFSKKLVTEERGIDGVWKQRVCSRCAA